METVLLFLITNLTDLNWKKISYLLHSVICNEVLILIKKNYKLYR